MTEDNPRAPLTVEAETLAELLKELRKRPNIPDREAATRIAKQFAKRVYRQTGNGSAYIKFLLHVGLTESEI